jgi:uncharacterized repeat protein (TIGR02543 family)
MDVSGLGIQSLRGIEFFSYLNTLDCSDNLLTELYISNNLRLDSLNCSNNQLAELDISNNSRLYRVNCSGNQLSMFVLPASSCDLLYINNQYKEGYIFDGWYLDRMLTIELFGFDSDGGPYYYYYDSNNIPQPVRVAGGKTIYAKWIEVHTVSYDTQGIGIAPASQIVDVGTNASIPTKPSAIGWLFDGWYVDPECTMPFDFNTAITEDITLYAKWTTVDTYEVSFNVNGHGDTPNAQTVNSGNKVNKPVTPNVLGYNFCGWYTDPECTEAYDFNSPAESDFTLYAKWVQVDTYEVTFDANGHGTAPGTQIINLDGKVSYSRPSSEDGYEFDGWYLDSSCTVAYNFNSPVTDDFTLYARLGKWIEDSK